MATLIKTLWKGYQYIFDECTDPRTKEWFLVARPHRGLLVLGIYLMFVLKWGPQWMKSRPAFNLNRILIAYNAIQVVLCMYIFFVSIIYAWGWKYKWICEPIDFSVTEDALYIAKVVHYYFLLKLVDLLDTDIFKMTPLSSYLQVFAKITLVCGFWDLGILGKVHSLLIDRSEVFFVLRKKFDHISFLHVYHHTGMVMLTWGAATYFPGGHATLIGVINSFVHVVMYSYYLLTVAVPSVKQSLWWKKYITQLQILQFFWCVVHMAAIVFKPDCAYPRWTAAVFLPQNIFMLILFIDFYIKAYIRKPKNSKLATNKDETKQNGHANGNTKPDVIINENGTEKLNKDE